MVAASQCYLAHTVKSKTAQLQDKNGNASCVSLVHQAQQNCCFAREFQNSLRHCEGVKRSKQSLEILYFIQARNSRFYLGILEFHTMSSPAPLGDLYREFQNSLCHCEGAKRPKLGILEFQTRNFRFYLGILEFSCFICVFCFASAGWGLGGIFSLRNSRFYLGILEFSASLRGSKATEAISRNSKILGQEFQNFRLRILEFFQ